MTLYGQIDQDPDIALFKAKRGLQERIEKWTGDRGNCESEIPGLWMYRHEAMPELTQYVHRPSICLIAQGSKYIKLGTDEITYDRDSCLVSSIDLPVVARIREASPEKPYLGLFFKLDPKDISKLLLEGSLPPPPEKESTRAMSVIPFSLPLVNAFLRLIDLLNEPDSIPFLAPPIQQEILYRILMSEGGFHLRQIGTAGSQNAQILRAVDWIKKNFHRPLSVERLAEYCNMSLSAFHHHFRSLTAMSPLQYQKVLRLQEARRLMLMENSGVTDAAFGVGYKSSSQFSREYSRRFGVSPLKDLQTTRRSVRNDGIGPGV